MNRMIRSLSMFGVISVFLLLFFGTASQGASFPNRGWREYFSGDLDAARQAWERAQRGRAQSPLSSLGLAILEQAHGDLKASFAHLRRGTESWLEPWSLRDHEKIVPLEVYAMHLCLLAPFADGAEEAERVLTAVLEAPGISQETKAQISYLLVSLMRSQGKIAQARVHSQSLSFLTDFHVIGPFDSPEQSGWQSVYPPEMEFVTSAQYEGKRQSVSWQPLNITPTWGYVNLANQIRPQNDATAYLSCFVQCSEQTPVRIWMGHAGAVKLWLNGELLLADPEYHSFWLDQLSANAVFESGLNHILVKLCSDPDRGWGVMLRITDTEGNTGVPYEIVPPPEDFPVSIAESHMSSASGERIGALPACLQGMVNDRADTVEQALQHLYRAYLMRICNLYHKGLSPDLEEVRAAQSLFDTSPVILKMLASLEKDKNRKLHALQKTLETDADDVECMTLLASLYQNEPLDQAAMIALQQALAIRDDYPPALVLLGNEFTKRGSRVLALNAYRDAGRHAPNWYKPWYLLRVPLSDLITVEQSLASLEKAVSCDKTILEPFGALLDLHLELGNAEDAESLVHEMLEQRPDHFASALQLGRWYASLDNSDKAEQWLRRALVICPTDPETNAEMGYLSERKDNLREARRFWNASLDIRPNDAQLQEYVAHSLSEGADYYTPFQVDWRSLAQPEVVPSEANVVCLLDQKVRRVYRDGTSRRTVHLVNRVMNTAGIRQAGYEAVYYVPSREEVVIHTARVITKSGQEIFAREPQVRSALDMSGVGSGIYSDYNVMVIAFNGVDRDSVLELKYEVRENEENLYSDYFGDINFFGSYDPTLLSEYTLIFPKERQLNHLFVPNLSGLTDTVTVEDQGDTQIYRWRYRNLSDTRREPMMPAPSETLPYLKVSTFSTWDEMTSWYGDLSRDSLKPDSTVKATARQLVPHPDATTYEKADAVFRYVSNEIRYLGLEFGIHGYKPHGCGHVNRMQYGDCKDKAVLAIALLKELDVPAQIVLLRTVDKGSMDMQLPSLGLFNHAIYRVAVPDLTAEWFDGTADYTAVGELPSMDQGAEALVIEEGGNWSFRRIPVASPAENLIQYTTQLTLSPNGAASGRRKSAFHGLFNRSIRSAYQNDTKNQQMLEQQFGSAFPGSRVSDVQRSDFQALGLKQWIAFSVDLPQFAQVQGDTLRFSGCLFPERLTETYASLTTRRHDLVNHGLWQKERTLTLTIPSDYRAVQLPEDIALTTPFGQFHRSYRHEGSDIIYKETLVFQVARVSLSDYPEFRSFCAAVDREQKREVVLSSAQR